MIRDMTFPEKLQKRLDELGWNQADLVRRTGVDKSTVSYWFQNKTNRFPRLGEAAKLAHILGVSVDYLADDQLDEPAPPLGAAEALAVEMIRTLNLSRADVMKRLSIVPEPELKPMRHLGRVELPDRPPLAAEAPIGDEKPVGRKR
jgi:transcriptional regulator with XRE-family HTH domain